MIFTYKQMLKDAYDAEEGGHLHKIVHTFKNISHERIDYSTKTVLMRLNGLINYLDSTPLKRQGEIVLILIMYVLFG